METGTQNGTANGKETNMYQVTRRFTDGALQGLEHTEITSVKFEIGFQGGGPGFGSRYEITAVAPITRGRLTLESASQPGTNCYSTPTWEAAQPCSPPNA